MTGTFEPSKSIYYPDNFKTDQGVEGLKDLLPHVNKICLILEDVSHNPRNPNLEKLTDECNIDYKSRGAALTVRDHLQSALRELDLVNGPEAREVEQKYAFALGAMYIATSQPYEKSVL